ncbi:MAG TPA: PqqD family protein [Pyrinomonadaceae bacterium]|nr:PqqD family protein [Pyrinomonadaceae bacterium]
MKGFEVPAARKAELVVQEVSDEVLVYDLRTNRAHCLNETAAFVWKSCNGENSVVEISRKCQKETGKPVSEEMIWLAIDQLGKRDLLEKRIEIEFQGQTRREALKKIGLGAMIALPIITSLTAPTAALAGTICANPACTCTLVANCTTPGGCGCNQQSTCTAECPSGCTCNVPNGAISCNGTCGA